MNQNPSTETLAFTVPGMSCGHCEHAVITEVAKIVGVESVDVDLNTKLVTVTGTHLAAADIVAAIDEAGYEASI